jgi:hypothetical protein
LMFPWTQEEHGDPHGCCRIDREQVLKPKINRRHAGNGSYLSQKSSLHCCSRGHAPHEESHRRGKLSNGLDSVINCHVIVPGLGIEDKVPAHTARLTRGAMQYIKLGTRPPMATMIKANPICGWFLHFIHDNHAGTQKCTNVP